MTSVQVSLPESLFAALRKAPHEVPRELRIAASIHWYQQSALSMERAAECAGLSRVEFLAELARRRVDVSPSTRRTSPGNCGMPDVLVVNAPPLIFLGNTGQIDVSPSGSRALLTRKPAGLKLQRGFAVSCSGERYDRLPRHLRPQAAVR